MRRNRRGRRELTNTNRTAIAILAAAIIVWLLSGFGLSFVLTLAVGLVLAVIVGLIMRLFFAKSDSDQ
jgi:hypothetical protein